MSKAPEKYKTTKDKPFPLHPMTNKPSEPTMSRYIDASKAPRTKVRGTGAMRQAKTFGKNG